MLIGSLLHLACPLILILIIDYIETTRSVDSMGGNVTLPKVRCLWCCYTNVFLVDFDFLFSTGILAGLKIIWNNCFFPNKIHIFFVIIVT